MRGVYLLHFIPRFKHAGHYLGYADDIGRRVYEHEFGTSGARLTMAASKAGVMMHLARVWPGKTRDDERGMKGGKGNKHKGSLVQLCPVCKRIMTVREAEASARRELHESGR